jgi:hypothetical protein
LSLCLSTLYAGSFLADALRYLHTLGVKLGDQESVANTITALQKKVASEQLDWKEANRDVETYTRAVVEMKDMVDRLLAHLTPLEAEVDVLSGTILDHSTEDWAKELSVECTTTTRDDLLCQNSWLMKKLENIVTPQNIVKTPG